MNLLNLPMFLTIEEGIFDKLKFELSNKFEGISEKKSMFFTSKGMYKLFSKEINALQAQFGSISLYFVEDSSYDIAVEAAKKILIEDYNLVIGFGGGKVLDTAKYAAYVSKKKYVSIPTTLSNDGLASPIAVLKTTNGRARSFGCKAPDGIMIDINLIKRAPANLLMAGVGDTVSNYTALFDWKLECKYKETRANDFAYLLSDTAFNMLLYTREIDMGSGNFIRQLGQSLVLSGLAMDIAGNSRPCSGSEHLFSHSLDEYYNIDAPHGIQVALGSIASCIFQKRDYKILLNFLKTFNVNVSPAKLGISREVFIGAWMKAQYTRPDRFTVLDTIHLSEEYLNQIYYEILEVSS